MMRIFEYDVIYRHNKGHKNGLANGLSRMKASFMYLPTKECNDWEDVANVELNW